MNSLKVFFALIALLIGVYGPLETFAQYGKRHQNLLSISPFGLVNKVRIGYERSLGKKVSIGVNGSYYYDEVYPGYQVSPFFRYYFKLAHHGGWYVHFNYTYFDHLAQVKDRTVAVAQGQGKILYELNFTGHGGGLGLGYQMLLGKKKNIGLDFMGGIKHLPIPKTTDFNRSQSQTLKNDWILMGPGSFFNGKVGLSYVF